MHRNRFIKNYEEGFHPWAHDEADTYLREFILSRDWTGKKILECGCGFGTEALWVARQGCQITAFDLSDIAVQKARKSARQQGLNIEFHTLDFLNEELPFRDFDLIYDRGFFHTFREEAEKVAVAQRIYNHLNDKGLWFSVIASADSPQRQPGPPVTTALQVVKAVEPLFEILYVKAGLLHASNPGSAKAWICLFQKR